MDIEGQYLTYEEYKALGGTLDRTPFSLLEFEARQNIDKYTYGRLKNLSKQLEDTKLCILKLIGVLNSYNKLETREKGVSSENTDGYSVSYQVADKSITQSKNDEIKGIVKEYLVDCKLDDGTPYLYSGRC